MTAILGSFRLGALVAAAAVAFALAAPGSAVAQKGDSTPKPKVDCSQKKNQKRKECANKRSLDDDELFHAGYWLAREGEYARAVEFLEAARNPADPRILTYLGFANRKLGRIDVALGYYARALDADPNYTIARAYLGEAHLQLGSPAKAVAELAEIEARCGTACEEYRELATAIAERT